jgi:hypothetical protein
MSYRFLPYTYGSKTVAEIDALPSGDLAEGDTVWNTEWHIMETYDGNIWVNDQSHAFWAEEGATIQVGNTVYLTGGVHVSNGPEVNLASYDNGAVGYPGLLHQYVGVVIRGQALEGVPNWLTVAFCGVYEVEVVGSTTRGDFWYLADINATESPGFGYVPALPALPAGGTACCGVIVETNSSGGAKKVKCTIMTPEYA